jgi:hypothetical protein
MSESNDKIKVNQIKPKSGPKEQNTTLKEVIDREYEQQKRLTVMDRKLEADQETLAKQLRHKRKWELKTEKNILFKEIYQNSSSMDAQGPSLTPSVDEWLSMSTNIRNQIAFNQKSNKPCSNSKNNRKQSTIDKEETTPEQSKATIQEKT